MNCLIYLSHYFITPLIATSIPIIGFYFISKKNREYIEIVKEKNNILWGEYSLLMVKSGGITAEDNKNKNVAFTGEPDIARQSVLNIMTMLEIMVENLVKFNDREKRRIGEYWGLLTYHTVKSFKMKQQLILFLQNKTTESLTNYEDEFLKEKFPNLYKMFKN